MTATGLFKHCLTSAADGQKVYVQVIKHVSTSVIIIKWTFVYTHVSNKKVNSQLVNHIQTH